MPRRTQLLIIDPQNDFCDLPEVLCPTAADGSRLRPALPVTGAHADLQRLASLVDALGEALDEIAITLDSHHRFDVAHPAFWWRTEGASRSAVDPFTPITAAQVRAGAYAPRDAAALARTLAYLDALESRGRYTLMVWPTHCVIGSWGHGIHPDVLAACSRWEERRLRTVRTVFKGDNPWTEHYSAVAAEVPDPQDPGTQLNAGLLAWIDQADELLVAGEASSHCVRATVEHIVAHLPGGRPQRLTLLTDAMSPVSGFEAAHEAFLAAMREHGLRLQSCAEVRGRLLSAQPA